MRKQINSFAKILRARLIMNLLLFILKINLKMLSREECCGIFLHGIDQWAILCWEFRTFSYCYSISLFLVYDGVTTRNKIDKIEPHTQHVNSHKTTSRTYWVNALKCFFYEFQTTPVWFLNCNSLLYLMKKIDHSEILISSHCR